MLRTPDLGVLAPVIVAAGGSLTPEPDGAQVVAGLDAVRIGDLAHEHGARVHELTTRRATLEEAFLAATGLDEEYRGALGGPAGDQQPGEGR